MRCEGRGGATDHALRACSCIARTPPLVFNRPPGVLGQIGHVPIDPLTHRIAFQVPCQYHCLFRNKTVAYPRMFFLPLYFFLRCGCQSIFCLHTGLLSTEVFFSFFFLDSCLYFFRNLESKKMHMHNLANVIGTAEKHEKIWVQQVRSKKRAVSVKYRLVSTSK